MKSIRVNVDNERSFSLCATGGQLVPVRLLAAAGHAGDVEAVAPQHVARAAGLDEARHQWLMPQCWTPQSSMLQ